MKTLIYPHCTDAVLVEHSIYTVQNPICTVMLSSVSDNNTYTGTIFFKNKTVPFSEVCKAELDELISNELPKNEPVRHQVFNELLMCLSSQHECLHNLYLWGPAGTGKTKVCMELAEELGIPFYFTNCVVTKFDLIGQGNVHGEYVPSPFYKAFSEGGLFLLDEFDASDPCAAIVLNAALANRMFDFPVVGNVKAHPNFRLIAAGNTPGMGATDMFTERQALDAATLDRFVVFKFDYDPRIEELLAKGNVELLKFIRGLRKAADKNQQRIVLGYRVIQQATAMLGIFSDVRIMSSSIFKDIDIEVVRMLIRDCGCHGRFVKAANEYVEYIEMA